MDGYTYGDIKVLFPEEYERRKQDKLRYRYPGGNEKTNIIKFCFIEMV